MRAFRLIKGTQAQAFHNSRAKIQVYAGGFGNGKTTGAVAKTIEILKDYPGITTMMGRNTYMNLEKTLKREFMKWLPPTWLKGGNKTDNSYVLNNGSTIDFRYVSQQSNSVGEGTSNLLSANYGLIVVDQIEDPEITEKDFMDMFGRLREQVDYVGEDPTMPASGPRWMILTANPSLGWVYKRIVKPIHDLRKGIINPDLLCERDDQTGEMVLDEKGLPIPIVELFEATTYENADNLPPDFIKTMEATFTGKMRRRYILGEWMAFDGVVYEEYDSNVHVVPAQYMRRHINGLRTQGYHLTLVEGYDLGITEPSCYLLALGDAQQNLHLVGGFYERNAGHDIDQQARRIDALRKEHAAPEIHAYGQEPPDVFADPAIFRSGNAARAGIVGDSVATMFNDNGITMRRANNQLLNGIVKVKSRLHIQRSVLHPYTGSYGSPKIFISDGLTWLMEEMTTWRWSKSKDETAQDMPVDRDNHAMDVLRYMCSEAPDPARMMRSGYKTVPKTLKRWHEPDDSVLTEPDHRNHRYG